MTERLHILNKSPDHPRSTACLAALEPGDRVILIEDGVLAVTTRDWKSEVTQPIGLLALEADCSARGVTKHAKKCTEIIDYEHFITLICDTTPTIWW